MSEWQITDEERQYIRKIISHPAPVRTICNVLRELYFKSNKTEQKLLIEEAVWMAKRMDKKLREYKDDWDKGIWSNEHNDKS